MREPRYFDVDWQSFDPWRISSVSHRLSDHGLLQPAALVELGRRLDAQGRVRTHSDTAAAGTSFNQAPKLHPNQRSAVETLTNIEDARAWMSLLNVQSDDVYRQLVDEVLDDLRPRVEARDPGMCYRAGWIFVTSPNAVTPFHMDKEHNFILQIRGTKTLYVWEPDDTEVLSEAARDLFHLTHSRERVVWQDTHKARARVFHLQPGMGAYMPSTAPHLVENGPGPSITASFTYYTDGTRRNSILHRLHEHLRQRGMDPAPVGTQPLRDACAYAACRGLLQAKQWRAKLLGQQRGSETSRYAEPLFS